MGEPQSLFDDLVAVLDPSLARAARDEAVERVERNTDVAWATLAYEMVEDRARALQEFTTDEVWERLPRTTESRALGPVMLRARKAGVIKPTNTYRNSRQVSRHGAPVRVWQSLVYEEKRNACHVACVEEPECLYDGVET